MIFRTYRYLFIIAFTFLPVSLFSQFTYIDISVGNKLVKLSNESFSLYQTNYNQTNIHVNGLWRFKRHLGIGMTASIPVRNGGRYLIVGTNGNGMAKHDMDRKGLNFDYYFKESAKVSINGRIYADIKGNFYVDGRISFFNFTEHLFSNHPGLVYSEENKFRQVAPGVSIGIQPHLGKKMILHINAGWDFYKLKDVGFKNAGPSESYLTPDIAFPFYFKSQLPDQLRAFSLNFGLGYFF